MYLGTYQLLQQTELEEFAKTQKVFTEINPCNIYFILKRPRLSLDKNYFIQESEFVELKYYIHVEDRKEERFLRIRIPPNTDIIRLESCYPYNYFKLLFPDGNIGNFKLSALVDRIQQQFHIEEPLLDFEVLYIGQAFGDDGKRTAIDRLSSHSTLQKIYSEAIQRNPDSEIWLMLANFLEQNIGVLDGRFIMPEENMNEDLIRFTNFMNPTNSNFTDKQKINFTEAGLIQMFMPPYNKEFKGTFPNPSHNSYDECYKLGVNGIVIETDLTGWRRWLYSEYLPRREKLETGIPYWQIGEFHFVTDEDRYKMFNNDYL